jgi:hypothetical protein
MSRVPQGRKREMRQVAGYKHTSVVELKGTKLEERGPSVRKKRIKICGDVMSQCAMTSPDV